VCVGAARVGVRHPGGTPLFQKGGAPAAAPAAAANDLDNELE